MNMCPLIASLLTKLLNDSLELSMLILAFHLLYMWCFAESKSDSFHHLLAFSSIEVSLWCSRAKRKLMQASKSSKRAVYLLYTAVYTAIQQLYTWYTGHKNKIQVQGLKKSVYIWYTARYTQKGAETRTVYSHIRSTYTQILSMKDGRKWAKAQSCFAQLVQQSWGGPNSIFSFLALIYLFMVLD